MTEPSLDLDAVKAFVMIADLKSFTRAAEALGTTQGAVSVKLKRLEDRVGRRLVERTPRSVRPSAQGAAFLDPARELLAAHERAVAALSPRDDQRFAIGIATHLAGSELPTLLSRLRQNDPGLAIELRLDTSRALAGAFDAGEIDAAIIGREDDRRSGETLAKEHLRWFAGPTYDHDPTKPLRLAALSAACGVHDASKRALDAAGIAWTEVFLGGGSAAIMAAILAGLAVVPLSRRVAPAGAADVGERYGLPKLGWSEIVLHSRLTDRRSREALRVLASVFREHEAR